MYDRILVTGGAGFVGSSLAMALQAAHPASSVTALDNLRRRGSELNLDRLRHAGVRFAHGDVRCREDLDALPETPELILECSAESSVLAGSLASTPVVQLAFALAALALVPLLYAGFAPPGWLRSLWREKEQDRFRQATQDLIMFTPDASTL